MHYAMSLRHSVEQYRLYEPRVNLELGFRAFEKCAPRLYNDLPMAVKNSVNIETFKKALKTHLFARSYDVNNMCIEEHYQC